MTGTNQSDNHCRIDCKSYYNPVLAKFLSKVFLFFGAIDELLIWTTSISLKSFQKHLFFHLKSLNSPKSKYWRPICSKDVTRPPAGQLYEKCSDFKSIFATFSSVSHVIMDGHSYFYRNNGQEPFRNRKFELSSSSIDFTNLFSKISVLHVSMKS